MGEHDARTFDQVTTEGITGDRYWRTLEQIADEGFTGRIVLRIFCSYCTSRPVAVVHDDPQWGRILDTGWQERNTNPHVARTRMPGFYVLVDAAPKSAWPVGIECSSPRCKTRDMWTITRQVIVDALSTGQRKITAPAIWGPRTELTW
jgi:hypothetical protein